MWSQFLLSCKVAMRTQDIVAKEQEHCLELSTCVANAKGKFTRIMEVVLIHRGAKFGMSMALCAWRDHTCRRVAVFLVAGRLALMRPSTRRRLLAALLQSWFTECLHSRARVFLFRALLQVWHAAARQAMLRQQNAVLRDSFMEVSALKMPSPHLAWQESLPQRHAYAVRAAASPATGRSDIFPMALKMERHTADPVRQTRPVPALSFS